MTHLQATWRSRKELWPWYAAQHTQSKDSRVTNNTTLCMSTSSQCAHKHTRDTCCAFRSPCTNMRTPDRVFPLTACPPYHVPPLTGTSRYHWRRLVGGGGALPPARPPWPQ